MGAREQYEARKATDEARRKKQAEPPKKEPWWFNQPLPIDRFTGWLMIYTLVMAFATIGSVLILYKTDDTLHQTLVTNQRPWVSAKTSITKPFVYEDDGASVELTVTMKNIGLTPAISVMSYAVLFTRNPRPRNSIEIIKESCDEEASKNIAVGYGQGPTLFPADSIDEIQTRKIEKKQGQPSFFRYYVVVCVQYKFAINDEIHRTAVIYLLLGPDENSIAPTSLRLVQIGSDAN